MIEFKNVSELFGCETFTELEKDYDDYIYYANGCEESVLKTLDNEEFSTDNFKFYIFDGWAIALWRG